MNMIYQRRLQDFEDVLVRRSKKTLGTNYSSNHKEIKAFMQP